MRGDLRPAAVDDDHPQARVAQKDHVGSERLAQRRVLHRVPAILDHDGGAVEARQPGQCLDEHLGLGQGGMAPHERRRPAWGGCGAHVEYAEFS